MSKGEGRNIIIKFTDDLVGDVSDNVNAFTVTGQEYQWVDGPDNNGPLLDKEYVIDKVERYPVQRLWELGGKLQLDWPGEMSITDAKCYEVTSGTTLTGTVQASADNIILATISHRSVFTIPNGWIKLYESNVMGSNQKMVFAIKKIDTVGEVSFTATQSLSGRMYLNLISISNISEIKLYENLIVYNPVDSTKPVSVPNKNVGEMIVWGMSTNLWKTSSPYTDWETLPNDLQMVSLNQAVTAPRQANFIDIGSGQSSGRTFNHSPSTANTECIIAAVKLIQEYTTPKTYTSQSISLSSDYRIRWLENKPLNTSILIEYTTGETQGQWLEVSNGDVVTSDTNLWLRVTLETTDTSITPILQDLWIEEPDAPQDKIRIVMDEFSRFPSVVGDITVEYDATIGNLAGRGGPVESFTEEFTPMGLVQKPNPGPAENFKMTAAAAVDFIKIEYNNRYTAENFKITAAATITLTFVGVVNP